MNKKRLLNVARALRESKNPDLFCMNATQHACGTPACALGHYVSRGDLQRTFKPLKDTFGRNRADFWRGDQIVYFDSPDVRQHFGISPAQLEELFGMSGCGEAKTANDAADYIERFVASN